MLPLLNTGHSQGYKLQATRLSFSVRHPYGVSAMNNFLIICLSWSDKTSILRNMFHVCPNHESDLFIYLHAIFVILHLKQERHSLLYSFQKNPQVSRNLDSYGFVCICFQAGERCLPLGLQQVPATPARESKSNKVSFLLCKFTVFVMNWLISMHTTKRHEAAENKRFNGSCIPLQCSGKKSWVDEYCLFLARRWGCEGWEAYHLGLNIAEPHDSMGWVIGHYILEGIELELGLFLSASSFSQIAEFLGHSIVIHVNFKQARGP